MPERTQRVALVEPASDGNQHAPFNAGLLLAIASAFPDAAIDFIATPSHRSKVIEELQCEDRPDLRSIDIEVDNSSRRMRLWRRYQIARLLCEKRYDHVVVATADPDFILAERLVFRRRRHSYALVCHGFLAQLCNGSGLKFMLRSSLLRRLLERSAQEHHLLAIGEQTASNILRDSALRRESLGFIEPPLVYLRHRKPKVMEGNIRVAFLGVGSRRKGFDAFLSIAQAALQNGAEHEFCLLGHLSEQGMGSTPANFVQPPTSSEMELGDVLRGVPESDCFVWLCDPRHYEYAFSASAFDSLRFGVPSVYVENTFHDVYEARGVNFGVRCSDAAELIGLLATSGGATELKKRLADNQPSPELSLRTFSPREVGLSLRALLDCPKHRQGSEDDR